jgi:hypothetical protein
MMHSEMVTKEAEGCVPDPILARWYESLAANGHDQPVAPMMHALLSAFGSDLSRPEMMSLINLPVVTTPERDPIKATLCDICLAVPRIREGFKKDQITLLAQIIFKFKRS